MRKTNTVPSIYTVGPVLLFLTIKSRDFCILEIVFFYKLIFIMSSNQTVVKVSPLLQKGSSKGKF